MRCRDARAIKLQSLTNRHLMSLLKESRVRGTAYWSEDTKGNMFVDWKFSTEEIQKALSVRPHIPNNNERRGLLKKSKPKQKRQLKYKR